MFSLLLRSCLVFLLCAAICVAAIPQSNGQKPKTPPAPAEPATAEPPQDLETLKTDTNLVSVPVVVTDAGGTYVADMKREEFRLAEDGVPQEIAFFATVSAPFHVVLMLDTSASTQEKLRSIQDAASAFVEQLQPADRVKVISFDDEVQDHNDFTNATERL